MTAELIIWPDSAHKLKKLNETPDIWEVLEDINVVEITQGFNLKTFGDFVTSGGGRLKLYKGDLVKNIFGWRKSEQILIGSHIIGKIIRELELKKAGLLAAASVVASVPLAITPGLTLAAGALALTTKGEALPIALATAAASGGVATADVATGSDLSLDDVEEYKKQIAEGKVIFISKANWGESDVFRISRGGATNKSDFEKVSFTKYTYSNYYIMGQNLKEGDKDEPSFCWYNKKLIDKNKWFEEINCKLKAAESDAEKAKSDVKMLRAKVESLEKKLEAQSIFSDFSLEMVKCLQELNSENFQAAESILLKLKEYPFKYIEHSEEYLKDKVRQAMQYVITDFEKTISKFKPHEIEDKKLLYKKTDPSRGKDVIEYPIERLGDQVYMQQESVSMLMGWAPMPLNASGVYKKGNHTSLEEINCKLKVAESDAEKAKSDVKMLRAKVESLEKKLEAQSIFSDFSLEMVKCLQELNSENFQAAESILLKLKEYPSKYIEHSEEYLKDKVRRAMQYVITDFEQAINNFKVHEIEESTNNSSRLKLLF